MTDIDKRIAAEEMLRTSTGLMIFANASLMFLIWLLCYKAQFDPSPGFGPHFQSIALLHGVWMMSLLVYINSVFSENILPYTRRVHKLLYGLSFVVPIAGIHLGYLSWFQ